MKKKTAKKPPPKTLTIPNPGADLLAAIDAKRGEKTRSQWCREVIATAAGAPELGAANPWGRPKKPAAQST